MTETLVERTEDKQIFQKDMQENFGLVPAPQHQINPDNLPKIAVPHGLSTKLISERNLRANPNDQNARKIISALGSFNILKLEFAPQTNGGLAQLAFGVLLNKPTGSMRFAMIGEFAGQSLKVLPDYDPLNPRSNLFRDDIEAILFSASLLPQADYTLGHKASIVSDNHIFSVLGRFMEGQAQTRIASLSEGQKSHAADIWRNRTGEELLTAVSENNVTQETGVLPLKVSYLGPYPEGQIPFSVLIGVSSLDEQLLSQDILTPKKPRILTPVEALKDIGYYRIGQNDQARSGVLKIIESSQKNNFLV